MTYIPWPKMMYRAEGDYRPFANAAEAAAAGPEWRTLDEIRGQVPPEPKRPALTVNPMTAFRENIAAERDAPPVRISPPDLDGDGKPGGCAAPADSADLSDLRAAYKAKFGKRPFMGWDGPTLTAKLSDIDAPNEDANGLTLREIHADLMALNVDFDPADSAADLLVIRDVARAERDDA